MACFIELTRADGQKIAVNADRIVSIEPLKRSGRSFFSQIVFSRTDFFCVEESPDAIVGKIAEAEINRALSIDIAKKSAAKT